MLKGTQYILHKHSKSIGSGKSKACKCKNVKEMGIGMSKRNGDANFFGVVPIGGAIIHPR